MQSVQLTPGSGSALEIDVAGDHGLTLFHQMELI
jgi:hypothetical protein